MKLLLTRTDSNIWGPCFVYNQRSQSLENLFGHFDNFNLQYFLTEEWYQHLPDDEKKFIVWVSELSYEPRFDYISDENISRVNSNKNTFLLIVNLHESYINFELFYESLKRKNIDFSKVVVLTSNSEVNNKVIDQIRYVSVKEFWESYYRYHIRMFSQSGFISPDKILKNKKPKKLFLSLNRNLKPHRAVFYHCLVKNDLINKGFVSYHLPDVEGRERYQNWCSQTRSLFKHLTQDELEDLKNYQPRYLDEINEKIINYQRSLDRYFYRSLFSLITESLEDNFITEKTFKTITHSHPFFIVGNSKVMHEELRSRGYRTFEDLFGVKASTNTLYPQDVNNFLQRIKDMRVKTLNKKIEQEYWDRVEHNYNHFFNREICFEKLIINRLKDL